MLLKVPPQNEETLSHVFYDCGLTIAVLNQPLFQGRNTMLWIRDLLELTDVEAQAAGRGAPNEAQEAPPKYHRHWLS